MQSSLCSRLSRCSYRQPSSSLQAAVLHAAPDLHRPSSHLTSAAPWSACGGASAAGAGQGQAPLVPGAAWEGAAAPASQRRARAAARPQQRAVSCAASQAAPPAGSGSCKPATADLVFEMPGGRSQRVHVFGIDHRSPQPHIAEFILQHKPRAVVVETALTPEHGAWPGNTVSCRDRVVEGPGAFFLRMCCQVSAALKEEAAAAGGDVRATELWKQVSKGAYRGEQLAYIAALTTGSLLVHGDRPKDVTYRRLYTLPSVQQLDEGYASQVQANYRQVLGALAGGALPPAPGMDAPHMVDQILMQEREAIMCKVVMDVATGKLPQMSAAPVSQPLEPAGSSPDVVLVVGSAHLPGLKALWRDDNWKELLGSATTLSESSLLHAPPLDSVPEAEIGRRRGLLQALLRLSVTQEVMADMDQTLGPIPAGKHEIAAQAIGEIYGSTRMMLACLPPDLLHKVWQGASKAGSPEQSIDAALEPLRQLRASNGGHVYSEEMVTFVRSLNFDLE